MLSEPGLDAAECAAGGVGLALQIGGQPDRHGVGGPDWQAMLEVLDLAVDGVRDLCRCLFSVSGGCGRTPTTPTTPGRVRESARDSHGRCERVWSGRPGHPERDRVIHLRCA